MLMECIPMPTFSDAQSQEGENTQPEPGLTPRTPPSTKPPYRFAGELPAALAHLRDQPRWVAWGYRQKGNKWTKPPFNPNTGGHASVSNPATWGTFAQARAAM